MVNVQVADRVHCHTYPHGGSVLLNPTTGQWHALNASASTLWRAWQAGESFEQGVATLAGRYPGVSPDRLRAEAGQLVDRLVLRGLLHVRLPERGAGAAMARAPETDAAAGGRCERLLAFGCLLLAVACARLPFRATYRLVRLSRRWCTRPAPAPRARAIVAAVQSSARWYPGRAACLELSLAAVVMAAVLGLRLDWCLGAAPDPHRFHAWVEAGGAPVPEPGEPAEQAAFVRVLTV